MTADPDQPAEGTLLFVYAADSGLFNTVADIAHKIFSPHSYPCRLCALTHGHFKVKREWQHFVDRLSVPCRFLHRDEAAGEPGVDIGQLPAVYRRAAGQWQQCLSPAELAACRDLGELMARLGELAARQD